MMPWRAGTPHASIAENLSDAGSSTVSSASASRNTVSTSASAAAAAAAAAWPPPVATATTGTTTTTAAAAAAASTPDMEAVFYRLHERLVRFVHGSLSRRALRFVEFLAAVNALVLLGLLVWFHYWYVVRAGDACVAGVLRREIALVGGPDGVDVLRIHVTGIWSRLEQEEPRAARIIKTADRSSHLLPVAPELLNVWLEDPIFVFAKHRGFLMLDDDTKRKHNVREALIRLDTASECFDSQVGGMERYLLDNFIGYDTVVLNAMGAAVGSGYLYSVHSRELMNVALAAASASASVKATALLTTLFLFFITTTLVHHTLRETQERMLKFTFDLQLFVRRGLGYRHLVLNHVLGSLVFVPIIVGLLFFLFEFFNDQLLAFMVLSIVWISELFSVITLRTVHNVRLFPRLFFLYFCAFHVYFFVFPSGFSYMALTVCVTFLQHAMVTFFVRFEIPAVMSGSVSAARPRHVVRDLLPEEVQAAGGGSLAVRALVGVRSSSASLASASASPAAHLPSAPPPPSRLPVQPPPGSRGNSGALMPPMAVALPPPSAPTRAARTTMPPMVAASGSGSGGSPEDSSFVARPARRKRATITGVAGAEAAGIRLSTTATAASIPSAVGSATALHESPNSSGSLPRASVVGHRDQQHHHAAVDEDSSSTGWEIGGASFS